MQNKATLITPEVWVKVQELINEGWQFYIDYNNYSQPSVNNFWEASFSKREGDDGNLLRQVGKHPTDPNIAIMEACQRPPAKAGSL